MRVKQSTQRKPVASLFLRNKTVFVSGGWCKPKITNRGDILIGGLRNLIISLKWNDSVLWMGGKCGLRRQKLLR